MRVEKIPHVPAIVYSARLKHIVRESDVLALLGGDEFTILVEDEQARDEVVAIAERMRSDLAAPLAVQMFEASIEHRSC